MNKQITEEKDTMTEHVPLTLLALIEQQGVSPIQNLDELSDLWPVDDDPDLLLQYVLEDRLERRQLDAEREPMR